MIKIGCMYCEPYTKDVYVASKTLPFMHREGEKSKMLPVILLRNENMPQSMIMIYSEPFAGKIKKKLLIKANYCPICGRFLNGKEKE